MASVTININCGSEEQNKIIANIICVALEDSGIEDLVRKTEAAIEVLEEHGVPEIYATSDPDDNEDPDHELCVEFDS